MAYGVYTYEFAEDLYHVFGPFDLKSAADGLAGRLAKTGRVVSVLEIEQLSERFVSPKCTPFYALLTLQFCFNCPAIPHLVISPDPAALDALGQALQSSPAVQSYRVLPLEVTDA